MLPSIWSRPRSPSTVDPCPAARSALAVMGLAAPGPAIRCRRRRPTAPAARRDHRSGPARRSSSGRGRWRRGQRQRRSRRSPTGLVRRPVRPARGDPVHRCAQAMRDLPARAAVILVALDAGTQADGGTPKALKAEQVAVLPAGNGWLVNRFADLAAGSPTGARSSRSSATGAALARACSPRLYRPAAWPGRVADRRRSAGRWRGPGPRMGADGRSALAGLVDAQGQVSPPALVGALPGHGSLAVLSFDRSGSTVCRSTPWRRPSTLVGVVATSW